MTIAQVVSNYNATKSIRTGFSPYEIIFGKKYKYPADRVLQVKKAMRENVSPKPKFLMYVENQAKIAKATRKYANLRQDHYLAARKSREDKGRFPSEFKVMDWVAKMVEGKKGNAAKFSPKWIGPFIILRDSFRKYSPSGSRPFSS